MPNMSEYVSALASEIGPRPAGTEEEQNAALFIEDTLKKTTSLPTQIEEFEGATGNDMTRLICAGVAVIAGLMFMITAALAIPALLLGLAAVVVFGADFMGKPLIARLFSKGVSQNVVAKYTPAGQQKTKGRKRKVIIVTRYDSGKVRPEMKQPFVRFLGIANRVSAGAIVFILFWMLFRSIFFMYPAGVVAIVLNVIMVLAMLAAALPLILRALAQTASYNDGANSSASGVAVMMEVAKRVADSEFAAPREEEEIVVHDAETAIEEGVVPEGAQVVYAAAPSDPFENVLYDQPEEECFEEPAQPVMFEEAVAEPEPVVQEEVIEPEPEPEPVAPIFVPTEAPVVEVVATAAASNVPDWFKSAQAKAKKSETPVSTSAYRSRYADAFDAMAAERAAAQAAAEQEAAERAAAERAAALEAARLAAAQAEAERLAAKQAEQLVEEPAPVEEIIPVDEPVVEEDPAVVEEVENDVEPEVVVYAHDGSNADILPEMLAEGREAIPEVAELEMPSFLRSDEEDQAEEQPQVQEYVENVSDFVGAEDVAVTATSPSISAVLPVLDAELAPIEDLQQQRAPLADGATAEDGSVVAKGLLNMLPTIDAAPADVASGRPSLNLPSLSGAFAPVSGSGSAGMTGSFAPVGEQLAATAEDPEDMFIDDVDESAFEENFTETGAFAGPDYVEMPKSRFGGLFGGLFKKGGSSSRRVARAAVPSSTSEWLDVDEDFDARTVGAARGDWSSFQEDSEWEGGATIAFDPIADKDNFGDDFIDDGYKEDPRRWEGGAFSAVKDRVAGAASGAAGAIGSVRDRLPFGGQEPEPAPSRTRSRSRRQVEEVEYEMEPEVIERPERNRAQRKDPFGGLGLNFTEEPKSYAFQEDEKIEQFQNPGIKTEVWFVALGSDMDGNAGMKAFLDTHASELRGAMILEIEGVGAGELSLVSSEGSLKTIKGSSRMKRYIRKAGQALGASLSTVDLPWNDSASACATAHGCQALHLAGIEDGAIALLGHAEDIAENIDEEAMLFAADYVMEVIRAV